MNNNPSPNRRTGVVRWWRARALMLAVVLAAICAGARAAGANMAACAGVACTGAAVMGAAAWDRRRSLASMRRLRAGLARGRCRAAAAEQQRGVFLENIAREVRTPLNGVIGAVELLSRTSLDPRQRRLTATAASSSRAALGVVNDLLDLSKMDAGTLEPEPMEFSPAEVAAQVAALIAERAFTKQITTSVEMHPGVPARVIGDPRLLLRVLLHLAENAVKFTRRGEVSVRAVPETVVRGTPRVRFVVNDTGDGIPEDELGRLFQPFSRGKAPSSGRCAGAGHGLWICKRFVEMMGGEIGVVSEVGNGSTFWFTLPLEPAAGISNGTTTPAGLESTRFLVVVDDPHTRAAISQVLRSCLFPCDAAGSASEALESLLLNEATGRPFGVALIGMPEDEAAALISRIKNNPATSSLVLMRLAPGAPSASSLREQGYAGAISPDVEGTDLLDAVVDALASVRQRVSCAPQGTVGDRCREARAKCRVLVTGENEVDQSIVSDLLAEAGYACLIAANGREAVDAALAGGIDLVLIDGVMESMDGFQASRAIRTAEASNGLPHATRVKLVGVISDATAAARTQCLAAGMNDCISQPLTYAALVSILDRHLLTGTPRDDASTSTGNAATDAPSQLARAAAVNLPMLDRADLLARCRGNIHLAEKLTEVFLKTTGPLIEEAARAAGANDFVTVTARAQAIKGSAASLALRALGQVAKGLELAAGAEDAEGVRLAIAELRDVYRRCEGELGMLRAWAE